MPPHSWFILQCSPTSSQLFSIIFLNLHLGFGVERRELPGTGAPTSHTRSKSIPKTYHARLILVILGAFCRDVLSIFIEPVMPPHDGPPNEHLHCSMSNHACSSGGTEEVSNNSGSQALMGQQHVSLCHPMMTLRMSICNAA